MMAMSLQPHTMLLQPFANLEMALSEALRITVGKEVQMMVTLLRMVVLKFGIFLFNEKAQSTRLLC